MNAFIFSLVMCSTFIHALPSQQNTIDSVTDEILFAFQTPMAGVVSKLSANISNAQKQYQPRFSKRSVFGKVKQSLKGKINNYVQETFARPTITSFKPHLKLELQNGAKSFQSKLQLHKRNGATITKAMQADMAKKHAESMIKKIHDKFVPFAQNQFNRWSNYHKLKFGRRNKLAKRYIEYNATESDINDSFDKNITESSKELSTLEKRSLLDPTKGRNQLIAFLIGFIITIPLFIYFAAAGIALGFVLTALVSLIIQPIVNKILLGYWFWYGP